MGGVVAAETLPLRGAPTSLPATALTDESSSSSSSSSAVVLRRTGAVAATMLVAAAALRNGARAVAAPPVSLRQAACEAGAHCYSFGSGSMQTSKNTWAASDPIAASEWLLEHLPTTPWMIGSYDHIVAGDDAQFVSDRCFVAGKVR